jgi:hypothetical protein
MFKRLKARCPSLETVTYWDMGNGSRVDQVNASACTLVLRTMDAEGKDFVKFGKGLQSLHWNTGGGATVWGKHGGMLTRRVGEAGADEEGISRLKRLTASFGLHRVAIERPRLLSQLRIPSILS